MIVFIAHCCLSQDPPEISEDSNAIIFNFRKNVVNSKT